MSLVPSLLNAILRLDGEALVMHVGEKPYVVAPAGQVELATRPLGFDALSGMVAQLLPADVQRALDEFGAVHYELPSSPEFPREHFSVVAARGGEDVWVEVRRHRAPDDEQIPAPRFSAGDPTAAAELPADDPFGAPASPVHPPDLDAADATSLWPGDRQDGALQADPLERADDPHAADDGATPATVPEAAVETAAASEAPPAIDVQSFVVPEVVSTAVSVPPPAAPDTRPGPTIAFAASPRAAHPAVVVALSRGSIRPDPPAPIEPGSTGVDRLLRIAAARGASMLYLTSEAHPAIRVDGEVQPLAGEAPLAPGDVESLLLDLMPERNREELRSGSTTEWFCDLAGVGRIRCLTFRDHRGAGGIFRMMPVHAISADQLGLSREIQALGAEPEGLVLVAGPRASGKSTLVSAFVDLINRTRRDHVITIESEIKVVHDPQRSLVSQREVRGSADEMLAVARAALRENPDVLVIEELRSADIVTTALDAAGSGHLVIASLPAHTAAGAVDRIIDLYPPEQRRQVQRALAETLRGVVAQVLVRRRSGGRAAAREVLLNTSAVAGVIAEGKTSQLPLAMESGRKHGMMPLNDALAGLVQSGAVDARDAYRCAADGGGLLALLKRQGIDTTLVERLA